MSFGTEILVKVGVVLAFALNGAVIFTLMDVKASAWMQRRPGPLHVGLRGLIFPLAEVIKFIQKEDIIPTKVDKTIFKLAPAFVLFSVFGLFVVVPISPTLVVVDLNLGVFYLLAISTLSTLGVLIAGWSSANKYSLMGGLRAAGQLIAYELPLILAVVGVVIQAETMSLVGIVEKQIEWGLPFVIAGQGIAFLIFMIAATAEMMRIPFDMPIGESELVMGFMTEYSGIRFLIFYIAEYINMFVMCAIASTLFLGGYHIPLLPVEWVNFYGPVSVLTKTLLLGFILVLVRWSFPRFREDQLQNIAWKILIPLSLLNILITSVMKVVF
ncbi:MAG: NADH-quinone oxidoreductase subunit H [Actinobacteria bacterium]|jgi:NADH-quinone oxidoreductase subunit H|nr:NADH-quinone oxidoreductase subunit H [Actinomycetota bacterium]|tara:strand:+ start:7145 stop:8125 length:981 start_codon:yes stop_codon:yes gene_type:complete